MTTEAPTTMCAHCQLAEVEYDVEDGLCTSCWMDLWFSIEGDAPTLGTPAQSEPSDAAVAAMFGQMQGNLDLDNDDVEEYLRTHDNPSGGSGLLWLAIGAAVLYVGGKKLRTIRKRGSARTSTKTSNPTVTETPVAEAAPEATSPPVTPKPEPEVDLPIHGLSLANDMIEFVDWTRWMDFANKQIHRAVAEGATTPEHVMARVFYAAFPDATWPPPEDSPLLVTYNQIVATAMENLDELLRPLRIKQLQKRSGLKLVD